MKKILSFSLVLWLALHTLAAQTGLVSGNLNVSSLPTSLGGGSFQVVGTFSDPKGQYFASDVAAGMALWKGNNYFAITAASAVGATLTLTVTDTYTLGFLPTGVYTIGEETERLKLPAVSTTGDSNPALNTPPDYASKWNYILKLIDAAIPNATEVSNVSDTSSITSPAIGDVLIAGDTLIFYTTNNNWTVYAPGGAASVTFSNAISDGNPDPNIIDIEWGGQLEHDTYVQGAAYDVIMEKLDDIRLSTNDTLQLSAGTIATLDAPLTEVTGGDTLRLHTGTGIDGRILVGQAGSEYNLPTKTPADAGLPAGQYVPVVQQGGLWGGTSGWLPQENILTGTLTPLTLPIATTTNALGNSRISHPTATRTLITHNAGATFTTTFDMLGTTAMVVNNRFSSDGNGGSFLSSNSGGTLYTIYGNDPAAGGYKSANSSVFLRFSNTNSSLSVANMRVRAPEAASNAFVDAFNVSANGFMGIGAGSTNPRWPLHVFGTGGMGVPVGTTAQRGYPQAGYFGFNTTWQGYEGRNDTNFIKLVHTNDVSYAENDILIRRNGRWTPTQKTANRVNSYVEIQSRNFEKGDVIFYAGGTYIVEDTTYLLVTPGSIRNYGNFDNAGRIQTANGKYAHLQSVAGSVPVSPFIASYSTLSDRSGNPNLTQIRQFDDTDALQRALDYTSRKKDALYLVLDQSYLTVTDTIVIENGVVMKGLHTSTIGFNQTPLKSRIYADLNDATKDVFQFSQESSGGYLSNTGITNCVINAVTPCNALIAMYENRNTVMEFNTLRGNYFFEVSNDTRHAKYGITTRGIANSKIENNEILGFKYAAIYFTNDWSYKNTTCSTTGNSIALCGNGIVADFTNIVSRDDVFQTLDTSAYVVTNGRLFAENTYLEEVPTSKTGHAAIRATTSENYTSVTINSLTASSSIDVSDETNNVDFFAADGYDRVKLANIFLAGYRRLITTDSVLALTLDEISTIGIIKSPIIRDYDGIDPITVVQINNSLGEKGLVANVQNNIFQNHAEIKETYSFQKTWLSDTLKIENLILESGHENLARFSDSLFVTNTPWIYNTGRVSVTQNDTLFQGQAIAEKLDIIGASPSLGLPITENFKHGENYTISFYYANSSIDRIGIATAGSSLLPSYKNITTNSSAWNRYSHTFTYLEDTLVTRLNIFLDAVIGDSMHITNFQLERSGSIYDTIPGDYIKTLSTPVTNPATITGNLKIVGGLDVTTQRKGLYTGTTDTNGDVVIAHGAGITATNITVTPQGNGTAPLLYQVLESSINSTNFTVRFFSDFSTAASSTAVKFSWSAE